MKQGILIFAGTWLLLGLLSLYFYSADGLVEFNVEDAGELGTLAASFSALALIVERFVSVFVRDETIDLVAEARRAKTATERLEKFEESRAMLGGPPGSPRDAAVNAFVEAESTVLAEVDRRTDKAAKIEKSRSQKFQQVSLIAGTIVAALGFRFFGQIAAVAHAEPIASSLFYIADVGFSGVLIGGGASFIDDFVVLFRKP